MIGRKLRNRYEVLEHLGDGSTATVYKALDTRLGRHVALKVLLPHVRETTRTRFFQEATAAAQLNHPNIMAIYDIDEEKEQYFLVVEYVEGEPLSDFVPSPPDVVVELGRQIAQALAYAHARQIVHRDIKPANIKVTPAGQIKIMDLGLALPREAKRVTAHGMIIGTPAYLSPEQAQGLPLDLRTDIYSLGVVLYEMATGTLPFDTDDIPALLLQQVKQSPPPPRLHAPEIPTALEGVILKALEKQPARRFQNGDALASALRASLPTPGAEASSTQSRTQASATGTSTGTSNVTPSAREPLRVILADDHTLLRKTLVSYLEARDEFIVIGEAATGEEALERTLALNPDVLILDLNMPGKGGLDVLPQIRSNAPSVKVLVLTGRAEDGYIMRALRAGAHGYILKSAEETELLEGITKVAQGHIVLGHGVAEKVVTGMLGGGVTDDKQLTDREREVLLYVAAGHENDAIARRLHSTMPQVIEALAGAMDKLGARDRNSAALKALAEGHILLDELHMIQAQT
jgi:serine/threonine protein kinase/DNA-binding CsgD family transcriptional regulator